MVIDEISFMKAFEVEKLNKNLQLLGDSNKPFGGFSIIFSGDFRQLEPCGAGGGPSFLPGVWLWI